MRSPARVFAWQFQRHLWPLLALAAYLVVMGLALPLMIGDRRVTFGDEVAAMVLVPWSILFFYFLAAFSFGLTGDLGARQSIYPARMFTCRSRTPSWRVGRCCTASAQWWCCC
jgi:hypothetical protein